MEEKRKVGRPYGSFTSKNPITGQPCSVYEARKVLRRMRSQEKLNGIFPIVIKLTQIQGDLINILSKEKNLAKETLCKEIISNFLREYTSKNL